MTNRTNLMDCINNDNKLIVSKDQEQELNKIAYSNYRFDCEQVIDNINIKFGGY